MKLKGPKYNKGDLVVLKDPETLKDVDGIGLIIEQPVLLFLHDWENRPDMPTEFWEYTINVQGRLFKHVPEQMIRSLKNENENNLK